MNFLCKIFGGSYDDLWKAIIRPGRDVYEQEELGPFKFEINGKCYKRTDFELINNRGLKLICSFWEPFDEERERINLPCVIYLHGNSSSRCEAYAEVKYLLPKNICLFSFDFSGCGKSEGEFISLGHYEKEDVHCVIQYLLKSKKVSKFGLWGRSMGAVTAIMYATEHPKHISALILDSGFYSLNLLIHELVDSKINLPNFIVERVLQKVKETVKEKAGFDLDEIEPYLYAKNCNIPALFCHGKDDNFVFPHHCKDLFNDYKCFKKSLNLVKGNHNTSRPKELKNKVSEFLVEYLKDDDFENDETIINCNTYQRIIVNNKIMVNYNDDDKENYYNNFTKIIHRQKYNSKDKNMNKNNFNNYINRGSTDENNIVINKNASQNMRAYSYNKYSKNDLKVINKKNTMNNTNNLNINIINVNKNRFEENNNSNNSISSSSVLDEPAIYTKKQIGKETPINKNRIRSISVSNYNINKAKIKLNKTPIIKRNVNKSLNKNVNMSALSNKKDSIYNLSTQSINYMNIIVKDNSKIESDKNINKAGKTFTNNFFKKYSSSNSNINNTNKNNLNFLNNYFTASNAYLNNYREIINNSRKNDDKINFNFYTSKRPVDEGKTFFRKKNQKKETKPVNLQENRGINILINKNKDKKEEIKEDKMTIQTENTILDDNEEIRGRNLPH